MSEELISISVDELKEAEQELKEFVAEKHLHYLSACEDTLSREYKITLRDKNALFDKVMKSGKTTEEIDKENFDNLMKGIHFTTEQICNYIANPEYYKESYPLVDVGNFDDAIEKEATKEAFFGLLRSSMSNSPDRWEKHFAELKNKKEKATYTAEELLEAEKELIIAVEEFFTDLALECLDELMEEYRPDEETLSKLDKYADDAFLEGIELEDFVDRVYALTFDDLKMAKINVSVSDVLGYIKDTKFVEKNLYTFITEDYKKAYIRKQYAIDFFSDMYEDDLNDMEDTEE